MCTRKYILGRVMILGTALLIAFPATAPAEGTISLFGGPQGGIDTWRHITLSGTTLYEDVTLDGRSVVRATADNSASMLLRRVDVDPNNCRHISWSWRVDQVQPRANLFTKANEDVAASIYLLFGSPKRLRFGGKVPTLRYVWTSSHHEREAVVDSPFAPGIERSIVVQSGTDRTGQWITEHRDVVTDFTRAFGVDPPGGIHAVALFTDNDQTGEPALAYYEWGIATCQARGKGMPDGLVRPP